MDWNPKYYANMINNKTVAKLFKKNAEDLGVEFSKDIDKSSSVSASTDMGNVSHVVPSIHPVFYIGSNAFNHTREFTTASGKLLYNTYIVNYRVKFILVLIILQRIMCISS